MKTLDKEQQRRKYKRPRMNTKNSGWLYTHKNPGTLNNGKCVSEVLFQDWKIEK